MFLDLHTHSTSSDDSRATVEQYVKWTGVLRRKGTQIDGFVLTEHRKFDFDKDYSSLAKDNDLLILKGSELDTDSGHFLVYGVTEELAKRVNFGDVHMDAAELVREMESPGIYDLVESDISLARRIGVAATPTMFLDGRRVTPLNESPVFWQTVATLDPADDRSQLVESKVNQSPLGTP